MTPDERLQRLRPPMLHRIANDRHATPELRAKARAELERRGLKT